MHFPQIVYKLSKAKFSQQKNLALLSLQTFWGKCVLSFKNLKNKQKVYKLADQEREETNTTYFVPRSVAYFQLVIDFF